jgi:hypothetical protein
MVDRTKEIVDLSGLPKSLNLSYNFYDIKMIESAGKEKRNHYDRKLIRVLSTKLSIEDYNRFQKYANDAYRAGTINKPSVSEFLRYIVTYPFNELGL